MNEAMNEAGRQFHTQVTRLTVVLALVVTMSIGADAIGAGRGDGAASVAVGSISVTERQASDPWPATGRVSYDVLRGENGLKLGEGVHRWQHANGRYEMSTVLETTGVAGLLYSFRYEQRSEGLLTAAGLVPERFTVTQKGRDPERASFDWGRGEVSIERRGRTRVYPVESADQDVLSVWHLAALANGRGLPDSLSLVTNRAVSEATLEVLGEESLRLPIGDLDTLRVRLEARSGKLTIDLWLSEAHALVPVRILMTDDRGEVLDQKAVAVEIDGDGQGNERDQRDRSEGVRR